MKLKDRFKIAREEKGLTQAELAKLSGCSQVSVGKIESGETANSKYLTLLADALGVNSIWLQEGKGNKYAGDLTESYIEIPFLVDSIIDDKQAIEIDLEGEHIKFDKALLDQLGLRDANMAFVRVVGNSMRPILPDSSIALVDTDNVEVIDGDMYAIDWCGGLYVRQVIRKPGGGLRIKSVNATEYPDETIDAERVNDVKILGKVRWYSVFN